MQVKTKRLVLGKVMRLAAAGEVKEIILQEDFLQPKDARVQLCFRGDDASGIVEFSRGEAEHLIKDLQTKLKLLKGVKVKKMGK